MCKSAFSRSPNIIISDTCKNCNKYGKCMEFDTNLSCGSRIDLRAFHGGGGGGGAISNMAASITSIVH